MKFPPLYFKSEVPDHRAVDRYRSVRSFILKNVSHEQIFSVRFRVRIRLWVEDRVWIKLWALDGVSVGVSIRFSVRIKIRVWDEAGVILRVWV